MDINSILDELGRRFELPNLSLNNHNICALKIDNSMVVNIHYDSADKVVCFFGVVAPLVSLTEDQSFEKYLVANLPSKNKGFNYFCVDKEGKELLLVGEIDGDDIEYSLFLDRLESFINYYEMSMDPQFFRDNAPLSAEKQSMGTPKSDNENAASLPNMSDLLMRV